MRGCHPLSRTTCRRWVGTPRGGSAAIASTTVRPQAATNHATSVARKLTRKIRDIGGSSGGTGSNGGRHPGGHSETLSCSNTRPAPRFRRPAHHSAPRQRTPLPRKTIREGHSTTVPASSVRSGCSSWSDSPRSARGPRPGRGHESQSRTRPAADLRCGGPRRNADAAGHRREVRRTASPSKLVTRGGGDCHPRAGGRIVAAIEQLHAELRLFTTPMGDARSERPIESAATP